jgi:formylglycine-generating enzyme
MRILFSIIILLFGLETTQAQCYQPLYDAGKASYAQKDYNDAIEKWQLAKGCSDAPKGNDIASKISDARREIAAIQDAKRRDEQAKTDARRREVQAKLDAQRQEEQRKEEARRKAEEAKVLAEQRKADAEQRRLQREEEQRRLEEEEKARRQAEDDLRRQRLEQLRIQEDNDFAEAKRINTDDSYLKFFEKYPLSKRIDEINQGFINAQDDRVWKKLSVDNMLIDYEQYLKLFPKGIHSEEATKKIAQIKITMPEMMDVKGSKFIMGSTDGREDEKPIDEIIISDFEMSKTEITLAQFAAYIEETKDTTDAERIGYSCVIQDGISKNREKINWTHDAYGNTIKPENFNHPVLHVSWNDAKRFCAWLRSKTGRYFRLPYEAEWEYAAGNGNRHTKYSWGDFTPLDKNGGNLLDASNDGTLLSTTSFEGYKDGFVTTAPVASFEPNDFGLHDMTGNVWEWCSDYYDATFYNTRPVYKNPKGNAYGSLRVMRGGSWATSPYQARVTGRNSLLPEASNYFTGFRVVVSK